MSPNNTKKTAWQFLFAALLAAAMALATMPMASHAAPPAKQTTQVPGYYRMAVGDFEVTALYDGYIVIDQKLLKGVKEKDVQSLLARMFVENTKGVQTAVNAYLVNTGDHLILVDTGAAKCFGPTLGAIGDNIRAAGYDTSQVDAVLLTHLHGDHACGLVAADGNAAFPNATVYVAKEEAGFWLSKDVMAMVPQDTQAFFKMAQDSVEPYERAEKLKQFSGGATIVPGVVAVPTPGHTPGHAGYLFSSAGQQLLVWGDIVHSHAIQFARPEVAIEYDTDSKQAIASRKKIFAEVAKQKLWVAGAHLPFPGIGHVRAEKKGYAWVPVEYAPLLDKQ